MTRSSYPLDLMRGEEAVRHTDDAGREGRRRRGGGGLRRKRSGERNRKWVVCAGKEAYVHFETRKQRSGRSTLMSRNC